MLLKNYSLSIPDKIFIFRFLFIHLQSKNEGEMLEWFKRHAWKACVLQKGTGGSNPFLSAKTNIKNPDKLDVYQGFL